MTSRQLKYLRRLRSAEAKRLLLQVLNVVIPRPGQGGAPDPPGVGKVTIQDLFVGFEQYNRPTHS